MTSWTPRKMEIGAYALPPAVSPMRSRNPEDVTFSPFYYYCVVVLDTI